jgi:hypothetical protein
VVSIWEQVYTLRGKRGKDGGKALPRHGVPRLRQQFQERLQGKAPFPQPGVGYLQQRGLSPARGRQTQRLFPEKENVDVQGPFSPAAFMPAIPAVGRLNTVNGFQQGRRFVVTEARQGGIKEGGLIGYIERIGFVKGGPPWLTKQLFQREDCAFQNTE